MRASGGAGSIAVALLAGRGFRVLASTGRGEENGEYLRELGAAEVVDYQSSVVGRLPLLVALVALTMFALLYWLTHDMSAGSSAYPG